MKWILFKNKFLYLTVLLLTSLLIFSCDKEDPNDGVDPTKIELLSFGPSPALRGGEIQFIGRNLDKVTEIILPDNISITSFNSSSSTNISLTVPEETVEGYVTLKTPQGDITTKSLLSISEPITISSISPAEARPGESITITGTYLNLIESVLFSNNKIVVQADFVDQSQTSIQVTVPADAQTGVVVVSNGEAMPILVKSETELVVTLPIISGFSPSPVKAGTTLAVSGSNLDLVKELVFAGNIKVTDFLTQSIDKIEVTVPADAKDGEMKAIVASLVEVTSTTILTMLTPTISSVSPNPAKPGTSVSIEGTDLDLVTSVVFGNNAQGVINSQSASEINVTVPTTATADVVTVNTAADKSVQSSSLSLIEPAFDNFSVTEIKSNETLTIFGTDLDLITEVQFEGGTSATPNIISEDEIEVVVPTGTLSGIVVLVTANGTSISSSQTLTILAANVPLITGYPESAKPGEMITLTGEKLDLQMDVIFPGDVLATQFGIKSATMLEVIVPQDVKKGVGVITFITVDGESTTSPQINFQGVDPVKDESLVFFSFNGDGSKDSWWGVINDGAVGSIQNDPALSLDGSSYARINGNLENWNALFFRNGANNFPGATIGTNISAYVLKFDINVMEPITGGEFAIRFRGDNDNDFFYSWAPWNASGSYMTDGWITVTIPLTDMGCPDYSIIDEDFGIAFNNGSSTVNVAIDNMRFEEK